MGPIQLSYRIYFTTCQRLGSNEFGRSTQVLVTWSQIEKYGIVFSISISFFVGSLCIETFYSASVNKAPLPISFPSYPHSPS